MRWILPVLLIATGCADRGAANRMKAGAFARIRERVDEQVRERPPETEREAKRLTSVSDMCRQGHRLAIAEARICRKPWSDIPDPEDVPAMEHAVRGFEEDVESEAFLRAAVEPFTSKVGLGNAVGAGGAGTIGLFLLKMLLDRKKMRRKDRALGKLFAFAETHSSTDQRKVELADPAVRVEYGTSTYRVEKKERLGTDPTPTSENLETLNSKV